jgi:hypothetical protein
MDLNAFKGIVSALNLSSDDVFGYAIMIGVPLLLAVIIMAIAIIGRNKGRR